MMRLNRKRIQRPWQVWRTTDKGWPHVYYCASTFATEERALDDAAEFVRILASQQILTLGGVTVVNRDDHHQITHLLPVVVSR